MPNTWINGATSSPPSDHDRFANCRRPAPHLRRCRASGRQLYDERGGAAQAVVLPGRGAAVIAREAPQREAGQTRETALDRERATGLVDDAERLVEPDRDRRMTVGDQRVRDARLGFGQRVPPRILPGPARAERAPAPREAAVQVDAAGVLPRAGSLPVR